MGWSVLLMAGAVLVLCAAVGRVEGLREGHHALQDRALRDKVFRESVAFEDVPTVSSLACAHRCFTSPRCVAFTVSPLPPSLGVVCRGYTSTVTSYFSFDVMPGARLYYVREMSDWLFAPCSGSEDCRGSNSECADHRCSCPLSFFYSRLQNLCVPRCADDDIVTDVLYDTDVSQYSQTYSDYSVTECR